MLLWKEFNTSSMDHRMFLGYEIYYRVVQSVPVNIHEYRDACSDKYTLYMVIFWFCFVTGLVVSISTVIRGKIRMYIIYD